MQIKIFSDLYINLEDLENKVNEFIEDKVVKDIKQLESMAENHSLTLTVLYEEYTPEYRFYQW